MSSNNWNSVLHCSSINYTHIELNLTALSSLSKEELDSLDAVVSTLNSSMGSCVKPHFGSFWHIFIFVYAIVGIAGATGNIYMIAVMFLETSFTRCINYLLFNLCLSNLVKCLVVLPISLYVLLVAHWRLGSFMCYASPLIQTFPIVVTVITYLLVSIDRYLLLFRPSPSNNPPSRRAYMLLILITWVAGFCMVLPLKTCVRYYDLNTYFGAALKGYGLCAIGFDARIKEINIALFMVIFAIPLLIMVYLMLKSSTELTTRLKTDSQALNEATAIAQRQSPKELSISGQNKENIHLLTLAASRATLQAPSISGIGRDRVGRTHSFLAYVDHEIGHLSDLLRLNRCLCTMLALFAACWAPLQCVMLVCYVIPESPEAGVVVDTLFIVCTLLGLSSTVTNPALLIYQRKSIHAVLHNGLRALRRLSSSALAGMGRYQGDQSHEESSERIPLQQM